MTFFQALEIIAGLGLIIFSINAFRTIREIKRQLAECVALLKELEDFAESKARESEMYLKMLKNYEPDIEQKMQQWHYEILEEIGMI